MVLFYTILGLLTNLILLIILAVIYKKGDLDEFNDFLECPGVNKKYFDKFSDVTKLRKFLIAFEIIDSIFEILQAALELINAIEKFEKKAKQFEERNFASYGIW